jgi:hypothetical protein
MTTFPLDLQNIDPRTLTILIIGTKEQVKGYIVNQHQKGLAELSAWSEIIPVPNSPGKFMSIFHKITT